MAINHELVPIALAQVDGTDFENFANAFFSAIYGHAFVPLGGMHDGGADGYIDHLSADGTGRFLQSSIRPDIENKVRDTIKALRTAQRDVKSLIYATSGHVQLPDVLEEKLYEARGVQVRVRDKNYFRFHINDSDGTAAAFETYLRPALRIFDEIGSSNLISADPSLPAKTLCVFLGQELERRRGNTNVLEAVTDTLVLWALRDTDPDKGKFLTRQEILDRIIGALPSAKQFVLGTIDHRLDLLTSKQNSSGREVRRYKKDGKYCLPYDTRKLVAAENLDDELLKARVTDVFVTRLNDLAKTMESAFNIDDAVRVVFRAIERTFQEQGLEVAHFLQGLATTSPIHRSISDHIEEAIEQCEILPDQRSAIAEAAFGVLRKTFYQSEDVERNYLNKLSRTYCLLFTLRNHPKIVDYFRSMSRKLVLYVGSDLFVRALSERFLDPDDAMTRNMFAILRRAGATLVLTERTLTEIHTHLIATDQEYKNHYLRVDRLMTFQLARQIDEILIRTYFYRSLEMRATDPDRAINWADFLSSFVTYGDLYNDRGKEGLRLYLCEQFGLEYEEDGYGVVDEADLNELTSALVKERPLKGKKEVLAENDAWHVLRVYSKRAELRESHRPNPYGYRTWWLTQETAVLKTTGKLVAKKGAPYIMRPEFLLNFIALSPSAEEVRKSYESVFPTLLGVQLSNRMKPELFQDWIRRIDEVQDVEEARARAMASQYSDQLKADQFKRYTHNLPALADMHKGEGPKRGQL